MGIPFVKYQGTGNDFVMLVEPQVKVDTVLVQSMCDRKFGIGADGLIVMHPGGEAGVDFTMHYFNADGSESFCGNGSRCAIHLAHYLGWFENETLFKSNDGLHQGRINDGLVSLEMHLASPPKKLNDTDTHVNTGSPHYVHYNETDTSIDIVTYGKQIRFSTDYKEVGINVNIYQSEGNHLNLRTYERGVEDETLSCGTGVTAVALSHFINTIGIDGNHRLQVNSQGGELSVDFNYVKGSFSEIYLNGPVVRVFDGVWLA